MKHIWEQDERPGYFHQQLLPAILIAAMILALLMLEKSGRMMLEILGWY